MRYCTSCALEFYTFPSISRINLWLWHLQSQNCLLLSALKYFVLKFTPRYSLFVFSRGGGGMACYNYLPIGVRVDFGPVKIKQEVLSNFCRTRILHLKSYTNKSTFSLSIFIFFLYLFDVKYQ